MNVWVSLSPTGALLYRKKPYRERECLKFDNEQLAKLYIFDKAIESINKTHKDIKKLFSEKKDQEIINVTFVV